MLNTPELNRSPEDIETHKWRKHYEVMRLLPPDESHKRAISGRYGASDGGGGGDFRASMASRITSTVSNPFINFESGVSANTLKMIKDAWAAKELRRRELQFSELSNLKIFVGTWNVNGQPASEPLELWLSTTKEDEPDLYVLGFQEVDLSTEAYIMGNALKEDEWSKAIELALSTSQTEKYIKVAAKQLVGMLMVVYIRRGLYPFLHDVSAESVGTGILGMMGNKGAVGIRLKLFDSFLCFVNAHLAADTSMVDRRNQDYQDICKRLVFPLQSHYRDHIAYAQANPWVASSIDSAPTLNGLSAPPLSNANGTDGSFASVLSNRTLLSIFDADHLFWLGDLNYRVPIPDVEAKAMIEAGDLIELLKFDQLRIERASNRCFNGFHEGLVKFPPTYKYDVGTHRYDTSEKRRSPSWCDRILWFGNPLKYDNPDWVRLNFYDATQQLTMSDHKPVRAHFSVKIRKLNGEKLSLAQEEINRELDKFENEAHPDLEIDANQVQFGEVRYMVPNTRTIVVENKGQVIAQFRFVAKLSEDRFCKPWCYVNPSTGALMPGERLAINITLLVDKGSAAELNCGRDYLEDILVLHTENGKDHFLTVSGRWLPSVFGTPLSILCRLTRPIRSYMPEELRTLYDISKADGASALVAPSTTSIVGAGSTVDPKADSSGAKAVPGEPGAGNTDVGASGVMRTLRQRDSVNSIIAVPPMPIENHLSIPKELWHIIDFLYKFGMDIDNLFLSTGDPALCEYFRECLDTGMTFNLPVLLSEPDDHDASQTSNESLDAYPSLDTAQASVSTDTQPHSDQTQQQDQEQQSNHVEEHPVNIDDIITGLGSTHVGAKHVRLPRSRGRAIAVHSAAETLMRFLEALPDPVVSSSLQRRCVLEGYNTFAAARQIVQLLPPDHYNTFVYVIGFLREVLVNYRGRGGLDDEKLGQLFAPILLQTMRADMVSRSMSNVSQTIAPGAGGGGSARGPPQSPASLAGPAGTSATTLPSMMGGGTQPSSPSKSTSSYIASLFFGSSGAGSGGSTSALGNTSGSVSMPLSRFGSVMSSTGSSGAAVAPAPQANKVSASMIGPPLPPEAAVAGGLDVWNRKRCMFLVHFFDPNNTL